MLAAVCLVVSATPSTAFVTQGDILSVASCNSVIDRRYFIAELTKQHGAPRNEQGAFWFTVPGEVYGTTLKEVFISSIPNVNFMGILLEAAPTEVVLAVPGSNRYPTRVFATGDYWVGADGRVILWHAQKHTKMFCSIGRD